MNRQTSDRKLQGATGSGQATPSSRQPQASLSNNGSLERLQMSYAGQNPASASLQASLIKTHMLN